MGQDTLGSFIEACCVLGPDLRVSSKGLGLAYKGWCDRAGEKGLDRKALAGRLQERGLIPERVGKASTRGWRGIGLLTQDTETMADGGNLSPRSTRQTPSRSTRRLPNSNRFIGASRCTLRYGETLAVSAAYDGLVLGDRARGATQDATATVH